MIKQTNLLTIILLARAIALSQAANATDKQIYLIPLDSDDDGQSFYLNHVEVDVEEFSEQNISSRLMLSTCERIHWLVHPEATVDTGPRGNPYKDHYGNGRSIIGHQKKAIMRLDSLSFYEQDINLAKHYDDEEFAYDGAFSLGKAMVLSERIRDAGGATLDNLVVSVYLKPINMSDSSGQVKTASGLLAFGGTNPKLHKDKINYLPLKTDSRTHSFCSPHFLPVRSVAVEWPQEAATQERNETRDYDDDLAEAQFDSASKLVAGPSGITDWIHEIRIGAKKVTKTVYKFNNCELDNKPNIVFTLGSEQRSQRQRIVLRPQDYVLPLSLNDLNEVGCVSAIQGSVLPGFNDIWSFGTSVLKDYYMVFDHGERKIGFATAA